MLGGAVVLVLLESNDHGKLIARRLMNRTSGFSLDHMMIAALGSPSLDALGGNPVPFLLPTPADIIENLAAISVLTPRIVASTRASVA
jgi:glutamate:Na+ symporter, ESS family